jgi:hypothetical protein
VVAVWDDTGSTSAVAVSDFRHIVETLF